MDEKALVQGLQASAAADRVKVLEAVLANQRWESPELLISTLVGALDDRSAEVRTAAVLALCRVGRELDGALSALIEATLRQERLTDATFEALVTMDRRAADVVGAALIQSLVACRDRDAVLAAQALLLRLGPDGSKFLKRSHLDAAAETLSQALPGALRDARIAAVDTMVELKVPASQLIEQINSLPWPPDEQVEVQRHLAKLEKAGQRQASAKKRRREREQTPLGLRILKWFLILLFSAPVVFLLVSLYLAEPLSAVVVLAVGLAIAFVVALFWFRCPSCKRFWAGKLERVQRQWVAGTATVRDTSGGTHTVATQRVKTTRHYRCRHCNAAFSR